MRADHADCQPGGSAVLYCTALYYCTVQNMLTACLAVQHPHLTFLMLSPGWVQTDMGGAGGRTADIGVEESVAGIYKVVVTNY